jgi:4a-hydroxytetrahydrobiopterin dehydratase
MAEPLNQDQIDQAIQSDLPGWHYEQDMLKTTIKFDNFKEAISFIVRVAFHAEQMQHHPDIDIRFNRVDIAMTSHDSGSKVTQKDIDLAKAIHRFNWRQEQ